MEVIFNRLTKNYQSRKKWIRDHKVEAFRLYEKDTPEYPYIIDIYKKFALIYEKGRLDIDEKISKVHRHNIQMALFKLLSIPQQNLIFKKRLPQKGKSQYSQLGDDNNFVIGEPPFLFSVNLTRYLDTGLFLDHRPMRQIINKFSSGKRFLNLFSYTGSMSVAAALGGAITTSVDMSATYQKWTTTNFTLNKIPLQKHSLITQNALDFLQEARGKKLKYELIFVDPPTFSNSKKMKQSFEIQTDHEELIHQCMELLTPQGTLYFSNNKRTFKLSESLTQLYSVKNISLQTIPPDFRDLKIHHCYRFYKRESGSAQSKNPV